MLQIQYPIPVKFICAFIYSRQDLYEKAKDILSKKYGKIDFESSVIDFSFTDYYYAEMGQPLYRRFISFENLRDPAEFADIKLFCIKLEKKFSHKKKRRVNIDPGYINEAKLVLTTTKDFSHRIYLKKGIYAEVTLHYYDGQFRDFSTTFPDYRTSLYKEIFHEIRDSYREQVHKK